MVAGGELEVAPWITGTPGRMGLPKAFELTPVRPARA